MVWSRATQSIVTKCSQVRQRHCIACKEREREREGETPPFLSDTNFPSHQYLHPKLCVCVCVCVFLFELVYILPFLSIFTSLSLSLPIFLSVSSVHIKVCSVSRARHAVFICCGANMHQSMLNTNLVRERERNCVCMCVCVCVCERERERCKFWKS